MLTPDMVIAFHRDAFNGALLRADYAALRLVYDDSYMLVRPSGQVLSKEEVLEDLEKASLSFLSISLEGTDVRIYGTTAVLTAESDIHTRRGENDVHAVVRLVAIYVARETALQLVHFQSTALPVVNP